MHCTEHNLRVDLVKHEDVSDVYLQHLKDYPGKEKFMFTLMNRPDTL